MAGKKTFTAGEVLTAGDVNDYLMDQTIMVFSGTAVRATAIPFPSEGMFTVTTNNDQVDYYNGSAWVSALPLGSWVAFTPTFVGFTLGNGTIDFVYSQIGKTVFVRGVITWGTSSSSGTWGPFTLTVPQTMATTQATSGNTLGTCSVRDASSGTVYSLQVWPQSTTTVRPFALYSVGSLTEIEYVPIQNVTPMSWAQNDQMFFNFYYETA